MTTKLKIKRDKTRRDGELNETKNNDDKKRKKQNQENDDRLILHNRMYDHKKQEE
jgi:hypothetical protein